MMQEIFAVNAQIVDANGTFNSLSGYPKAFKSTAYDNNANGQFGKLPEIPEPEPPEPEAEE